MTFAVDGAESVCRNAPLRSYQSRGALRWISARENHLSVIALRLDWKLDQEPYLRPQRDEEESFHWHDPAIGRTTVAAIT